MKKILTLFAAVVMAANMWAQETPSIQAVSAQESATNPGMINIVWMADSTVSKVYVVYLYALNSEAKQISAPIAFLAAYAKNFAITGYPGYYGIGSNLMLQYGQTYLTLKENTQISAENLAAFKQGWEENVDDTDWTLNAGNYYVTVTGYDITASTITETSKGAIVSVVGKTEAVENVFESTKPVKFIAPDGQIRILRDGKLYNMSGTIVK